MNRMQRVFSEITRNRFSHSALKDFSSLSPKSEYYLPISKKLGSYCAGELFLYHPGNKRTTGVEKYRCLVGNDWLNVFLIIIYDI